MRYQLNRENYHTFETMEVNRLPGRSYFIPYPDRVSAEKVSPKEKRYASPKVVCLNGDWDFHFYPVPAEMPEVLDTDTVKFDRIKVPGCWQTQGYDRPFYVNIRYQFPFRPPEIPQEEKVGRVFSWLGVDQKVSLRWKKPEQDEYNFVGVYRRYIDIDQAGKRMTLSFLGAASCLDLYMNGEFVGYSEGAHNTAEFDVTNLLKEGRNEMVCVVHRWCTGTYLEDQDMFRHNGIFRDVLLRIDEDQDLWDIDARTKKTGETYTLTAKAQTYTKTPCRVTLKGEDIGEITLEADGDGAAVFENLKVREWSAETPVLYDLYFETESGCVREKIGFKTVEIRGDVFLVNGKKIKFRGVNHHDTSPTGGYTMTPDEIERDLRICKEYNIDTIRTSHYPPDPLLLELADEMGIYIVDENDLETHGTFAMQIPPTYNTISHDPKWVPRYLDRITRLYQRDKIHATAGIFMWSLGNEAGGYHNMDAMYDYLKAHSDLPVHYESAVHCKRIAYDVGSEMYPSVQMVHDVGEHQRKQKQFNDRPYFMCEYAHAMGVGPGNTEAYWQEIYTHDNLMGGCVWEMVDHAILMSDGTLRYGGDSGEWEHDGNFCCDGLFYPDRTPSTGADIIRFIYRPIRVRRVEEGIYEIFNTTGFTDGKEFTLRFVWNDGTEREIHPEVAPLSKAQITLAEGCDVDGTKTLLVIAEDAGGRVVSREQIIVSLAAGDQPDETGKIGDGWRVENGKLSLTGKMVETGDPGTILYRARTDNDTNFMFADLTRPYVKQKERFLSQRQEGNQTIVESEIRNGKGVFHVTDIYEGIRGGVMITSRIHCERGGGDLPRFGKTFRLPESFDLVTYFGRTGESYCDMKDQYPLGEVNCHVSDMTEPNIRPQESGNRCDCTVAKVSDGQKTITFEAVDAPFELAVKPYTDLALTKMKHREDEKRTGTYVTIQAFQQGIGTGACGPGIMEEYRYSAKNDYVLTFIVTAE